MEEKRYRIAKKKVVGIFVLVGLLIESFILGGYAIGPLLGLYDEINWTVFIVVALAIAAMMIVFCIMSLKGSYYVIDKKGIRAVRPGKDLYYSFDTFLYIDEKYSEKHKVMLVYNNVGKDIYIPFDEEGKIYEAALKYSTRLISKEEYKFRFPDTKI